MKKGDRPSKDPALDDTVAPVPQTPVALDATLTAPPAATVASTDTPIPAGTTAPLPEVSRANYAVGRELARGGMGRILVAEDLRLGRRVALKELLTVTPALAQRFAQEVRVTARLQHPGIVPVYEAGRWPDGEPFYAMKLVTGRSLEKVVQERPDLDQRLALVPNLVQLAEAMAYAHGQKIIHRDLKPANVLVGDFGETVVIDWGLAKALDDDEIDSGESPAIEGLTMHGAIVGTPAYMPPEQARGEPVDERADVYALGALIWHVLAGRPPVSGTSLETLIDRVKQGRATTPLADAAPGIPAELATIVDHAMAAQAADRYPTARELAADLSRFQTGQLVATHRYTRGQLVRRWIQRHRAAVLATLALLVSGAIIATIAVRKVLVERDIATSASLAGLEEQGRRELIAGHPRRAAVFLSEAYRHQPEPSETLREMLGEAMRAVDREIATWAAPRWIKSVTWLDETRVVAAGDDGSLTLWDTATDVRRELLAANDLGRHPNEVVASSSGEVIAVLADHSLVIAPLQGKPATVDTTFMAISDLAISPDGQVIALGGDDGVRTFRRDGTQIGRPATEAITSLAFRAGELVYGAARQTTLDFGGPTAARVFECSQGTFAIYDKPKTATSTGTNGVGRVEGNRIVEIGKGSVERLWCAGKRAIVTTTTARSLVVVDQRFRELEAGTFQVFAIDREGGSLATATAGVVSVWDLESGLLQWTIDAHTRESPALAFAPSGRKLATAGDDGSVRIWRVEPPRAPVPSPAEVVVSNVVALDDGRRLEGHDELVSWVDRSPGSVTAGARDGRVLRWDVSSAKVVDRKDLPSAVMDGSIHAGRMAVAGADGVARLFGDGVVRELGGHRSPVFSVAWSPDGSRLLTSGDTAVRIWDPQGQLQAYFQCDEPIGRAWWIDASSIAVAGQHSLQRWDVDRQAMTLRIPHGLVIAGATARAGDERSVVRIASERQYRFELAREVREPDGIAASVTTKVPYRLVGTVLVPTTTVNFDQRRSKHRQMSYDLSGDTFAGTLERPTLAMIANAKPGPGVTRVREAIAAFDRGDRKAAGLALDGLVTTDDPHGDLALAWSRYLLHEDEAGYSAARRAVRAATDAKLRITARHAMWRLAARARLSPATALGDVSQLGIDEGAVRGEAAAFYSDAGRDADVLTLVEGAPPSTQLVTRIEMELTRARVYLRRGEPTRLVVGLEDLAKVVGSVAGPRIKIDRCADVTVMDKVESIADAARLTGIYAATFFATFRRSFDFRYAQAARRLFTLMAAYPFEAADLTRCQHELDVIAREALLGPSAIDKAEIRALFRRIKSPISTCYNHALVDDPQIAGRVLVRFVGLPNGELSELDVATDSASPGMQTVVGCVREQVKQLVLPRQASGTTPIVTYPMLFKTVDQAVR